MNKLWILASGIALFVGIPLLSSASKAQGLMDKIKLYPGIPAFKNYKDSFFNFLISVQVMNQSDFEISINNLFVSVQYQDPQTGLWTELLTQNQPVSVITLKKQSLNKIPSIPLSLPFANAGIVSGLILGKINPNLKVVSRFEYSGIEVPAIEQTIDAKAMVAPLRSILTSLHLLKGLGETSIELA